MNRNLALLAAAGAILGDMGVAEAAKTDVMTTESMAAGQFMNRAQVDRLVDLTVSQSGWLNTVSLLTRAQRAGEIPRMVLNDVVTEGVNENGGNTVTSHPDPDNIAYNCGKFQATWYLTVEDLREARASGEPDFDGKVRKAFAKAMGNDMARAALKGDEALAASSRLNRLLRKRDGWLKQIRAAGHRRTTTRGSAFAKSLFYSLHAALPEQFRDDASLRWFYTSLLDAEWSNSLGGYAANGSELGGEALTQRKRWEPLGIPQLLVPQMPVDEGFSRCSGATAVPGTVTAPGGGTIKLIVDTVFGGYSATFAGRKLKVTFDSNGQYEICTVADSGSTLSITTTGSLGQSSISTTSADYSIDLADITPVFLTNPANLFLVMCDQVRAYRCFEQASERWRIDVFYEADFGLYNTDAVAMQDGVITPTFTFGA